MGIRAEQKNILLINNLKTDMSQLKDKFTNSVMTTVSQAEENNARYLTQNTDIQPVQKETLRTEQELKQALQPLAMRYGISTEKILEIALKTFGRSHQNLLNIRQDELNKVIKILEYTIEKSKNDREDYNLDDVTLQAKNYKMVVDCGWDSPASIDEANRSNGNESLAQRMKRVYGIDITKVSREKQVETLKNYFERFFDKKLKTRLQNAKTPEEVEKIKTEIKTLQITDFAKLLYNTKSDEERALFADAIKSLCADSRYKGFEAIYNSFVNDTNAVKFLDETTPEDVKDIVATTDGFGDAVKGEDTLKIGQLKAKGESYEGSKKFNTKFSQEAADFFKNNAEALKTIAQKEADKNNGKPVEFTQAEKELILQRDNYFKAVTAGRIIGNSQNAVMTEAQRTEIHTDMITNVPDEIRDAVVEHIQKFIEEHSDEINLSTEQLNQIVEQVKTGEVPPVLAGSSEDSSETNPETTAQSPDYGFNLVETKPQITQEKVYTNNDEKNVSYENTHKELSLTESRRLMLNEVYKQTQKTIDDFKTLVEARLMTMAEAITGALEQTSTYVQSWGKQQLKIHDNNGNMLRQVAIDDSEKVDLAIAIGVENTENLNVCYTERKALEEKMQEKQAFGLS